MSGGWRVAPLRAGGLGDAGHRGVPGAAPAGRLSADQAHDAGCRHRVAFFGHRHSPASSRASTRRLRLMPSAAATSSSLRPIDRAVLGFRFAIFTITPIDHPLRLSAFALRTFEDATIIPGPVPSTPLWSSASARESFARRHRRSRRAGIQSEDYSEPLSKRFTLPFLF